MKTAEEIAQRAVSGNLYVTQVEYEIQEYARQEVKKHLVIAADEATAFIGFTGDAFASKASITGIEIELT